MQWNSTPSALEDDLSHSLQECQGQRHRPLGSADSPTQSKWYTCGHTSHSSSSPPSLHRKHSLSCHVMLRFLLPCLVNSTGMYRLIGAATRASLWLERARPKAGSAMTSESDWT